MCVCFQTVLRTTECWTNLFTEISLIWIRCPILNLLSNLYSCVLRDGVACSTEQWTNIVLAVKVTHLAERSWGSKRGLNKLSIAVLPQTDDETCVHRKHRKYSQNAVLQSLLSWWLQFLYLFPFKYCTFNLKYLKHCLTFFFNLILFLNFT